MSGGAIVGAIAGAGLLAGSIMFSKHNPGMGSRSPRSWLTQDEGIEAMKKCKNAAEYIMNKRGGMWHSGAGTDFNAI